MNRVLLDSDVFSFLFKRDSRAALYAPDIAGTQPCLCFQSVAELRTWTVIRRWGIARRKSLESSILRCVVLPSDDGMARLWAEVTAQRRGLGRPIECGDAWIAAAALRHDLTLLSHNAGDFEAISGLRVITHLAS